MINENSLIFFKENLFKIPVFKSSQLYWRQGTTWMTTDDNAGKKPDIESVLENSEPSQRILKLDGIKRALISSNREIIAVLELPRQTRNSTLNNHLERFDECIGTASTSYHAYYDELTGVLNRRGIKHFLESVSKDFRSNDGKTDGLAKQISNSADIALFAFDIDRFKSVNDTYGHDVGDVVLASFAARLNAQVAALSQTYRAKFIFGRPGGEEFELMAIGSLSKHERHNIGELLLGVIREPFEPQGNGKELVQRGSGPKHLPTSVTASIGLSSHQGFASHDKTDEILSSLRKEADTALYRAKADGRDRLRTYADIRLKHGRVLEFHESSQLVQIDIGSNVGVFVGQDYTICFPPFTGSEKMRSATGGSRVLGNYPMVVSAKAKIIKVDKEFSTAIVVERSSELPIPVGSLLRYVFTGSSVVPAQRISSLNSLTHPVVEIYNHIQTLIENKSLLAILCFDVDIPDSDTRQNDVVRDEILSLMHVAIPSRSRIFYTPGCGVFAVITGKTSAEKETIENIVDLIKSTIAKIGIKIFTGICQCNSLPSHACRSPEALIFYASTALKCLTNSEAQVITFDEWTPIETINAWRKQREIEHCIADYQQFRKFGFDFGELDNHLGVTIAEAGAVEHYPLADAAFTRAATNDPGDTRFRANLALIMAMQGKFDEAYKEFSKVIQFIFEQGDVYLLAYAKSAITAQEKISLLKHIEKSELLSRTLISLTSPPSAPPFDLWWREIKETVEMKMEVSV
jgi:diguanylate cyclase (GGDEF)-like protein